MDQHNDIHYMRSAINMGWRGVGRTSENPSVGCVVVKNGAVISRGRTADGGRPHAERLALMAVGVNAKNATLYVTLEPCAHHGQTPPCVDAIIDSGVKRVVVGVTDPDPRTGGASLQKMKDAGIDVVCDVLRDECINLHRGFLSRITQGRPFVTLKCACTLDGKIACENGESQWITGHVARRHVHLARTRHDAILIGSDTALYDDPMLTTRLDGVDHNIIRVVMDRTLKIKIDSKLVQTANEKPLLILHETGNPEPLLKAGAKLINVDCSDVVSVLKSLAERGINNLLIEGGAKIHASFLKNGAFDELMIYRAPTILGGNAKSVVSDMNIDTLTQRLDLMRIDTRKMGVDLLERYKKKD